jgi:3-dehydroquinate dehydratase
MTFGTMGHSSAPGQMKETELHQVLDIIHENFER